MLTDEELLELEALVEDYDKKLCRDDFYAFCRYMDPEFYTDGKPHLKLLAHKLQLVEQGVIKKLMISLPPRGGKSYTVSLFVAWFIGKHPEKSIMRNAYGDSLAKKFSRDIRGFIQSPKYQEIFPDIKLKDDHRDVSDWAVIQSPQSTYFCAGVGGGITGKGCNGMAILDDPIKNIEQALSETVLENVWQWYTSTHKSRMEKGCPEIQIATRWSRKDVIGKLRETQPDEWDEVIIPALDDDGETFCDEIKTTEEYYELKKITDTFIWEAEFMQHPIESKGLLFPIEDLNRFAMKELKRDKYGNIACAFIAGYTDTADEGTDFLASLIGVSIGEYLYITEVVYTQDPVELTEPAVAQMIIDTGCHRMEIESNSGGKSFAKNVKRLITGLSKCTITWKPTTSNKETRILMKSGIIKKYFYFRKDYEPGSDYDHFMRWLTSYVKMGKNEHDDAADASTGLAEFVFEKKLVKAVPRP